MTEKPQLYLVGDTGPVIETNDDLDALALDADAQADRMSFGPYSMSASGLRFDEDLISGSFKILGRARDPDGQDWARGFSSRTLTAGSIKSQSATATSTAILVPWRQH